MDKGFCCEKFPKVTCWAQWVQKNVKTILMVLLWCIMYWTFYLKIFTYCMYLLYIYIYVVFLKFHISMPSRSPSAPILSWWWSNYVQTWWFVPRCRYIQWINVSCFLCGLHDFHQPHSSSSSLLYISASLFRYNGLSVVYFLFLLTLPLLPNPSQVTMKGEEGWRDSWGNYSRTFTKTVNARPTSKFCLHWFVTYSCQ